MKKVVSILLILAMVFTPLIASAAPFDGIGIIKPPEINSSGLKPAEFSTQYTLKGDVVRVSSDTLLPLIKSEAQVRDGKTNTDLTPKEIISNTGYIKDSQLRMIKKDYKIGTILVDEASQTAVKINSLPEAAAEAEKFAGYVAVGKPQLSEVLEDFKIPRQTVEINYANIVGFGEGMEGCLVSRNDTRSYAMAEGARSDGSGSSGEGPKHLQDPFLEFKFNEKVFTAKTKSGASVNVKLSGYLGIDKMRVTGEYSAFDGYEFYLSAGEEMYLKAEMAAQLKEEAAIPILTGINIPAGIANVKGGLFLIVGIDGNLTLKAEAREWFVVEKAGISGGTFALIPTSFRPLLEIDKGFDADASFSGAVNGYVKVGPMFELEIFGWDTVGTNLLFGCGAKCTVKNTVIDADICGIVDINAKLTGKKVEIINWKPSLLHKQQTNTEGYIVTFKEACAYRNIIWGKIEKDNGVNGIASYVGSFNLVIKNGAGVESKRHNNIETDENGEFSLRNISPGLNVTDQIIVEVPATGNAKISSAPVSPTFPFGSVVIDEADYLNDYVKGHVPVTIVKDWDAGPGATKELIYTGDIVVNVINNTSGTSISKTVKCDKYGNFKLEPNLPMAGINVYPDSKISAVINAGGFTIESNKDITPTVNLMARRIVLPLKEKVMDVNGQRIDSRTDRETFIVYNLNGSKPVLGDVRYNSIYKVYNDLCFVFDPFTGRPLKTPSEAGNVQKGVRLYRYEGEVPRGDAAGDTRNIKKDIIPISPTPVPPALIAGGSGSERQSGSSFVVNDFVTEWAWAKPVLRSGTTVNAPNSVSSEAIDRSSIILTGILKDISDYIETEVPEDTSQPQNSIYFKYESPIAYREPSAENPSPIMDIGYLRRTGELKFNYEGQIITLADPDDTVPQGDGSGGGKNFTGINKTDRYLGRMIWGVDPSPEIAGASDRASKITNISGLSAESISAIKNVVNLGIMDLGEGGAFKFGNLTRGEGAAYVIQCLGIEQKSGKSAFIDIPPMHPYLPQINAAGLISGRSTVEFGAFDSMTREQMADAIMKGLKLKYGSKLTIKGTDARLKDAADISEWAAQSVNEIAVLNIMKALPDGSFKPKGSITFAEAAVILDNLNTYMKKYR